MDNNFTNQNPETNELEEKVSAVTPIVPDPEPLANMGLTNDVNMGQMPNINAGMDQTMFGQPAMNQTMYGQPAMDPTTVMGQSAMDPTTVMGQQAMDPSTAMGQSAMDPTTVMGQSAMDPTTMGQTMYGQPAMGQQATSQTMYGQPAMGQTTSSQTMYGQPAMGQTMYGQPAMGQTMYGQQSMMPQGKAAKVKKPKKPKKPLTKGKIAGIIAGSTVGVAAVVCGVIFIPKLFRSPKKVVLDAVENTFGISTDTENVENDKYGFNATMNEYYANGGESNVTVTIDGSAFEINDTIAVELDSAYDPNAKLVNSELSMIYNDNDVASVEVIGTENDTYIRIVDMIDGYFAFPNDLQTFLSSPIFGGVDLSGMPNTSINYFEQSEILNETGELSINSGYVNAIETLWDKVSVDKKGKKKIDVNGKTVKATKYIVTIDEEDIEKAAQEALNGLLEMAKEQEAALAEEGLSSADLEMLISQLDVKSLISGDLSFDVYVKDDKVVKIEADDKLTLMYVNINYNFFLDIDDNNISSALTLSIPMAQTSMKVGFNINDLQGNTNGKFYLTAGDESVDLTFDSVRTESGTKVTRNFNYALESYDVSAIKGTLDITTDSADDSFDTVFTMTADGETMTAEIAGAVEEYTPGKSYTVSMDKVSLAFEGEQLLNLAIDYSVTTESHNAHNVDSSIPVYDLSTMTEQDLSDIAIENSTSVLQWTTNFLLNTGELGQSIIDIFGTTSVEEPVEEPVETPSNSVSFDNAILSEDGYEVKIEDAIDGFTLDYVNTYFIDLVDDNKTVLEYEISTDASVEELLTGMDELDCNIIDYVENETIDEDGIEIHYSKLVYNSGEDRTIYKFARYIDDDVYLVVTVIEDGKDSFDINDLVKALTDRYVTIK